MPRIETTPIGIKVSGGFDFDWKQHHGAVAVMQIERSGSAVEIILTPPSPKTNVDAYGHAVQKGPGRSVDERYQCYMDAMLRGFPGEQHGVRRAGVHQNYYGLAIDNTSVVDVAKALEEAGLAPAGTTNEAQRYMREAEGRASIRAAAADAAAAQKSDAPPRS